MQDPKLLELLDVVIDNYICKWDPVGSKFLHSLDEVDYAPSTLRKYLHILEKAGLVYQPYNSSGRIPTIEWFSTYLTNYISNFDVSDSWKQETETENVRKDLKYLVESLGQVVDGVIVGFVRNDEYYYLGINNLLRDDLVSEYETTRHIVRFIENKDVVKFLDTKIIKRNEIYYTFIQDKQMIISCVYAKVIINDYDCILSIVGPTRVDYKKNVKIMAKVIKSIGV